ncbi:MAG: chemotaxis protein CheA [Caulobacter sp.]|nr:chemotaxis protein CheA [Caulobacter sp.]
MDEMEAIKATFFQECEELLADLEVGLLAMQAGPADGETVNAVFRAVHSIKGGAGAFGFEGLVRFAHVFETLMDGLRSGKIEQSSDLVAALLRAADLLADLVEAARGGAEAEDDRTGAMAAELQVLIEGGESAGSMSAPAAGEAAGELDAPFSFQPLGASSPCEAEAPFTPLAVLPLDGPAGDAGPVAWSIAFRPRASLFHNGNEPALILRELERLGPATITLDASSVPPLASLDPEASWLSWEILLTASCEETEIREVFEFVDGDCDLSISRAGEDAPAEADTDAAFAALLASIQDPPAAAVDPDVAPPVMAPPVVAAPVSRPVVAKASTDPQVAAPQATIRVDPERIDRLIDLVGELVINQAMLAQRVMESGLSPSSAVSVGLDDLEQLTREIQESVMAIRAQPVKSVFQRMPRLVRETAAMTGKQVRLVTDGENTEVDKTVIERLAEPITHMIRNAIDHGLETPEARIAAGKNPEGMVRLAALHRGGRIVIEVADDGAGINRRKVLAIATDRDLVAADAQLSDEEIDNLIFLPGFSTATQVSDVSGRGVGMDVVRRSIQALGGRISIASRPGEGSTFTLSLPLTLAVLDGMVIDVAGHTMVAPLSAIVESLRPKPEDVRRLGPTGMVLAVRDTHVPLLDIGCVLGFRTEAPPASDRVVLLVEAEDGSRAALVADGIHGQRQVVIKSLEANYRQVPGIAAATILGDGRVALILDVDAVMTLRPPGASRAAESTLIAAE